MSILEIMHCRERAYGTTGLTTWCWYMCQLLPEHSLIELKIQICNFLCEKVHWTQGYHCSHKTSCMIKEKHITPGTLMTSAAADVINHNRRKIGRFKPIRFCYARMMSAQSWSRHHHCFEPTSSLWIIKRLYLIIYMTLALIFPVQLKEC